MSRVTEKRKRLIREEIESQGYTLHNEYNGYYSPLEMTCPNGHYRKCSINSFRVSGCGVCEDIKAREQAKKDITELGYIIVKEPIYAKDKWELICPNGHKRHVSIGNFRNHSCPFCKGDRRNFPYTYTEVKEIFRAKNCILLTPEADYVNCKTPLEYLCHCGRKSRTTLDAFKNNDCSGCQKCMVPSGEDHSNWQGGITPENVKHRNSEESRVWRNAVFSRDKYTCQCCFKRGISLEAHHIKGFSEHPELRTDVNNGITLCIYCHALGQPDSFHTRYTQFNNTKEQLIEYIITRRKELGIKNLNLPLVLL